MNAAVDLALQQSGGLENAQVFRHRRQGNVEGGGQFGDGGLALGEARENGAAGGIGKGAKGGIEGDGAGGIVNHMV